MVRRKDQILSFLNTKEKNPEIDPEKRWIKTANSYLNRIMGFIRWLCNQSGKNKEIAMSDWKTQSYF